MIGKVANILIIIGVSGLCCCIGNSLSKGEFSISPKTHRNDKVYTTTVTVNEGTYRIFLTERADGIAAFKIEEK